MAATRLRLIAVFLALSMISLTQCDLLPFPACFLLEMSYKSLGCASGLELIDYCDYIALALRLQLENGEGLCDAFPCTGYDDDTGRECTNLFPRRCSSSDRIKDGICPIGKECCDK